MSIIDQLLLIESEQIEMEKLFEERNLDIHFSANDLMRIANELNCPFQQVVSCHNKWIKIRQKSMSISLIM